MPTKVLRDFKRGVAGAGSCIFIDSHDYNLFGIMQKWQRIVDRSPSFSACLPGHEYGSIVVDLERRQVIDLLPDRKAATTARWLAAHPEIEVISRDRCGLYAVGAAQGAPQARQVADRFHLLQNLRDVIERQLSRGPAKIVTRPVPGGAKVRIDRFRIKGLRNFRPRYPSRSIQRPGI